MPTQGLALTLLLALATAAEDTAERRPRAIADLAARQTLPAPERTADACAVARQITSQRPCLAAGDCPALELWRSTFGPPRNELLDPDRRSGPELARGRGARRGPPESLDGPPGRLAPGTICPAGPEP